MLYKSDNSTAEEFYEGFWHYVNTDSILMPICTCGKRIDDRDVCNNLRHQGLLEANRIHVVIIQNGNVFRIADTKEERYKLLVEAYDLQK
jgi:hypothetical protein